MPCSAPNDPPHCLSAITCADDYFVRVSAVVQQLNTARDPMRAVELLRQTTLCMGAERSIFASFIRDDDSCESFRLLLACDPEWLIDYEQQRWHEHDPWLAYARTHCEPVRGTAIPTYTPEQKAIVALAERFGFRSTVIVPTPSSGGLSRAGALCLGSATPGYFEGDGYLEFKLVARGVASEFHDWWVARMKDELVTSANITVEDIALLAHERRGHSSKVMARDLQQSITSINSRFQRLNIKLKVPSRRAAARKAAEYGLI